MDSAARLFVLSDDRATFGAHMCLILAGVDTAAYEPEQARQE